MDTIKINDTLIEDLDTLQREVVNHFQGLFREEEPWRPQIGHEFFSKLSHQDAGDLIRPFSEEEIKDIVFSMDPNKSPGPDGFLKVGFAPQD